MGIASIWTGLGLRTSGPDHRAPWKQVDLFPWIFENLRTGITRRPNTTRLDEIPSGLEGKVQLVLICIP